MSNVIRSIIVKIGADTKEFQTQMKNISKDLKATSKSLGSAGASLTKGITVPIVGAVTGLTGLAITAGHTADDLITMANKTGISTQALQELQYASRFVDVEVSTMTDSMYKMTQRMADAKDGTGEQAEAFQALGVAITNQDGSLRSAKDVWSEAIGALGNVANEAERDALAYEIFGKSAQELNPLIVAGTDELHRLQQEAHDVGAVMSDENVTALGKFDDSMQKLQAVIKNAGSEIGAAFLPALEALQPILTDTVIPAIKGLAGKLSDLFRWFGDLSPGMQKFILGLVGAAVAMGPVLTIASKLTLGLSGVFGAVGKASKAFSAGKGFISVLSALLGPAGLALAAIAAIAAIAFVVIKNWDKVGPFFTNLWNGIKNTVTGIKEAVVSKIGEAVDFIKALPGQAFQWGADLIAGFINGIKNKAAELKESIKGTAQKIKSAFTGGPDTESASLSNKSLITKTTLTPSIMNADANRKAMGNTILNFTGNTIMSDRDIDVFGDKIVSRLKLAGVRP